MRGPLEVPRVNRRLLTASYVHDLLIKLAQVREQADPSYLTTGAGLVDEVDRAPGKRLRSRVRGHELHGGFDRLVGDGHAVMRLEPVPPGLKDVDAQCSGRRPYRELLQDSSQRGVACQSTSERGCRTNEDGLDIAAAESEVQLSD
jgi:hypothetical protein